MTANVNYGDHEKEDHLKAWDSEGKERVVA